MNAAQFHEAIERAVHCALDPLSDGDLPFRDTQMHLFIASLSGSLKCNGEHALSESVIRVGMTSAVVISPTGAA